MKLCFLLQYLLILLLLSMSGNLYAADNVFPNPTESKGSILRVAADSVEVAHMVIRFADNSELRLLLDDEPELSFTADNITFKTKHTTLDFLAVGVLSYRFETLNVSTGIKNLRNDENGTDNPVITAGNIVFDSLSPFASIAIYDMQGQLQHRYAADGNGHLVVDLRQLPKGIYIVRTSAQSFKVTNR